MTALNKQALKTENERMAQSLAERNGEPVEGLRQRISELEEIATDYGMKFQKAQDALKHQALLHKSQLEAVENNLIDSECHVAELEEALRDKQALLEAVEKRIAELEARTPYGYLRQCDGQIQISIGSERPHDRSGGYATPWFAIYTAAGIGVKGE